MKQVAYMVLAARVFAEQYTSNKRVRPAIT